MASKPWIALKSLALWALLLRPSFLSPSLPQRQRLRARPVRALEEPREVELPWNAILEKCQGAAQQNFEIGGIPALIPPGLQYNPDLRSYYEGNGAMDRMTYEDRPFRAFSDAERAGRPAFPFENEEQESDYELALKYFERWDSEPESTGVVLDLGCGNALMARRFAQSKHFATVYALDILWAPLAAARGEAEAERTGPLDGLFLLRGDAQSLPLGGKQLDFVWWGLGIHKVQDAEEALRNVRKALRPGGRLMATTRTFLYPPFELRMMSNAAGFHNISVECVGKGTSTERLLLRAEAPNDG